MNTIETILALVLGGLMLTNLFGWLLIGMKKDAVIERMGESRHAASQRIEEQEIRIARLINTNNQLEAALAEKLNDLPNHPN